MTKFRTQATLWAVACTVLLTTGCAPQTNDTQIPTTEPGPQSSAPPADDSLTRTDEGAGAQTAEEALRAYFATDQPQEAWWEAFSQYLTMEAFARYETTDPSTVARATVNGPAIVTLADSATEMHVLVPTDQGQYRVQLNRQHAQSPWFIAIIGDPTGDKP